MPVRLGVSRVAPNGRVAAAIVVEDATKVIDGVTVLDSVSFTAEPGRVTAFLGPNGAGKSTTLRAILGIDHLDAGRTTIGGRSFRDHSRPVEVAGALLTPDAAHPRRTARDHLPRGGGEQHAARTRRFRGRSRSLASAISPPCPWGECPWACANGLVWRRR